MIKFLIILILWIHQLEIVSCNSYWKKELMKSYSDICSGITFNSLDLNTNFSLKKNLGREFTEDHDIERHDSDIIWKLHQQRTIDMDSSTYDFSLPDIRAQDLRIAVELFHVPFIIDVALLATQLLSICGHSNDTIGVTYGNTTVQLSQGSCYDFTRYNLIYTISQFKKIRFVQEWGERLKVYEIYKNFMIERYIEQASIKYLTKLVLAVPGREVDYLPYLINPINVVLKKCDLRPETGINRLHDRRNLNGIKVYRYIRNLCRSVRYPGIYHVASKVIETLRLYKNTPLVRDKGENNKTVIKVQFLADFNSKFHNGKETFKLFAPYGNLLSINLVMWEQTIKLGPTLLLTMNMTHVALDDETCYVKFINKKDGTFYEETITLNSKIFVIQTPTGVNFTVKSMAHRPGFVDLPNYFIYSGTCRRAQAHEKLFNFGSQPYMSVERILQFCDKHY